jgi:hypothetical protein
MAGYFIVYELLGLPEDADAETIAILIERLPDVNQVTPPGLLEPMPRTTVYYQGAHEFSEALRGAVESILRSRYPTVSVKIEFSG